MPTMPKTFRPGRLAASIGGVRSSQTSRDVSQSLYDGRWDQSSRAFLINNPLCRYCDLEDIVTAASLVDHFWPHRGDRVLFWRREFWVASCSGCHSSMKQRIERAGLATLRDLARRLGIASP